MNLFVFVGGGFCLEYYIHIGLFPRGGSPLSGIVQAGSSCQQRSLRIPAVWESQSLGLRNDTCLSETHDVLGLPVKTVLLKTFSLVLKL